ncbi:MAG: hypothetical protein ACI9BW_001732 [Gammaproteobacteria bacterium]|jgi:hypothetical protein
MAKQHGGDKKKMHLLGFLLNGLVNHMQGVWKHPRHHQNYPGGFARPEMWQDTGRILERGKFDGLFLADVLAPYQNFGGNSDSTLRHAMPHNGRYMTRQPSSQLSHAQRNTSVLV